MVAPEKRACWQSRLPCGNGRSTGQLWSVQGQRAGAVRGCGKGSTPPVQAHGDRGKPHLDHQRRIPATTALKETGFYSLGERPVKRFLLIPWWLVLWPGGYPAAAEPPLPKFEAQTIDSKVAIGYGVAIGDVDGDGKPDILLADKRQIAWYRNGDWKKFVMAADLTAHDNVCLAARDINGDGQVEVAVGANWNPGETSDLSQSGPCII